MKIAVIIPCIHMMGIRLVSIDFRKIISRGSKRESLPSFIILDESGLDPVDFYAFSLSIVFETFDVFTLVNSSENIFP